jgi:hypothetical protein
MTESLITLALVVLFWVLRSWIVKTINSSVEHSYSRELEKYKSELRRHENKLEAAIENQKYRIDKVVSSSIENLTSGQTKVFERRVKAVEELWTSVCKVEKIGFLVKILQHIDLVKAFNEIDKDPSVTEKFSALFQSYNFDDVGELNKANEQRPFLSLLTWMNFKALVDIYAVTVLIANILTGKCPRNLLDERKIKDSLKQVFSKEADAIDKSELRVCLGYLESVKFKLLESIKEYDLKGIDINSEAVSQATSLIKTAEGGLSLSLERELSKVEEFTTD